MAEGVAMQPQLDGAAGLFQKAFALPKPTAGAPLRGQTASVAAMQPLPSLNGASGAPDEFGGTAFRLARMFAADQRKS